MDLEEFLETGSPEQKELLFTLLDKIEEYEIEENEIHRKIERIFSSIDDIKCPKTIRKDDFKNKKANIAKLLKIAVEEYGMGELDVIKKFIKKYKVWQQVRLTNAELVKMTGKLFPNREEAFGAWLLKSFLKNM